MSKFGKILRSVPYELRLDFLRHRINARYGLGVNNLAFLANGKTSEIYSLVRPHARPDLVIKTPPLRSITNDSGELDAFDKGAHGIINEMKVLSKLCTCGFVNAPQYAFEFGGAPFLIFRKRHNNLRKLINASQFEADLHVRLSVLHMIARGLVATSRQGVIIHQDLKPENILFDYLALRYELSGDSPPLAIPRLNDFEIADDFSFGHLRGFRPYLPPEHYTKPFAEGITDSRYDIYSLSIISYELISGGFHPMNANGIPGTPSSSYVDGFSSGLKSEEKWKRFARKPSSEKPLPAIKDRLLSDALKSALDPDYRNRPTAPEMASAFADAMRRVNSVLTDSVMEKINFFEYSGEQSSEASRNFPQEAEEVLAQFGSLTR